MIASITGIGQVTPWGSDLASFKEAYLEKRRSLRSTNELSNFDVTKVGAAKIALLGEFDTKPFITPKNFRKYDDCSRLGIAATKLALDSFEKKQSAKAKTDGMGIIYASETQGKVTGDYLTELFTNGPAAASPRLFPLASANATGSNVSMELQIVGPNMNISSRYASGFSALATGINLLRADQANDCMVGSADVLCSIYMEVSNGLGAYKRSTDQKSGFFPGEGAASLVISKDEGKSFGKILSVAQRCSNIESYRWPNDARVHAGVLAQAKGDLKIDKFFTASNGDEGVDSLERAAFAGVFKNEKPEWVDLKAMLGESATLPLLQVIAACCEPKGTRSMISVLSPGGIHGAVVIEAGTLES